MLKNIRRRLLRAAHENRLIRSAACLTESTVYGGNIREAALVWLLKQHYKSAFRRQWVWRCSGDLPHFTDHRIKAFFLAFGDLDLGPFSFYRGFYNSELIREGDRLLDIGCGDGFFTRRFFSPKCSQIDAVDIEDEAIEVARRHNAASNICYRKLDAVNESFPSSNYDIVVWDGALGHFCEDDTAKVLEKISISLNKDGVFGGSESLGLEGHDHLQYFHSLGDLEPVLRRHFKYVQLRSASYRIGVRGETMRQEAYWRCTNNEERLGQVGWKRFDG